MLSSHIQRLSTTTALYVLSKGFNILFHSLSDAWLLSDLVVGIFIQGLVIGNSTTDTSGSGSDSGGKYKFCVSYMKGAILAWNDWV